MASTAAVGPASEGASQVRSTIRQSQYEALSSVLPGLYVAGLVLVGLVPSFPVLGPALVLYGLLLAVWIIHAKHHLASVWLLVIGSLLVIWLVATKDGLEPALCLAALSQCPKLYFDYNLLNMQSKGLPSVVTEKKLINAATNSVLFGAVIAPSLDEAVRLERQLDCPGSDVVAAPAAPEAIHPRARQTSQRTGTPVASTSSVETAPNFRYSRKPRT